MYLKYYKLDKDPFSVSPDPEFLFLSSSHREAAASVYYGVAQRKGFVVVVGEVGTGKTTILRDFMGGIDRSTEETIYIFNSNLSFTDLLRTILDGSDEDDPNVLLQQLYKRLIATYREGRNVALIIDEAQNMPIETLENLRMLSNLETNKNKLIQIVLAGQPELDEKLNAYELRQLKQRIVIRAVITPLTRKESYQYIQHRLATAAAKNTQIFKRGALRQIVKHAHGIPRNLNILCDNALLAGFAYHERPVSATTAKEVIRHRLQKTRPRVAWGWATAVGILAIVGVIAVMLQGDQGLLARRLIDQVSVWQADPAALTPTAVESQTSEAIEEAGSTRVTESTAMEPEPGSVLAGGADFEAQAQTLEPDPERASASLGAKVEKTAAATDGAVQGAASPETEAMPEAVVATEGPVEHDVSEITATDGAVQGAASPETEAVPEAVVATEGSVERDVSETAATDAAVQGAVSPETEAMPEAVVATEGSVEQDVSETEDELVAVSIPERTEEPITEGESLTKGKPDRSSEIPLGNRPAELAVAEMEPTSVETRPASAVKPASNSPVLRLAKFVKSGDTLGNLCIEVYGPGYANHDVFAQLKQANPSLIDENLILPGQWIVFPELPDPLS